MRVEIVLLMGGGVDSIHLFLTIENFFDFFCMVIKPLTGVGLGVPKTIVKIP